MRRFTSFAVVLAMLAMMLPSLACASRPTTSRMEQSCCQQMHGKCSVMAKQGCCQVTAEKDPSLLPAHVIVSPGLLVTTLALLYPLQCSLQAAGGYGWQWPEEHSPPGLLIASFTVLRI